MNSAKRKVCVVLVDRANYGRLKPVMRAIRSRPELILQVLCAGTMVLERFDQPVGIVRSDGFQVDGEIFIELEGSTPTTMAKSLGFGVVEFASEFRRLSPDVVVIIGDRYEALSAALAAAYMNLPLLHLQGGEISGSIDESARHCITKLAQFHFPATPRAAEYLLRMGERRDAVLGIGCPSSDIARELDRRLSPSVLNARGAGVAIDPEKPFLLAVFHPVTTEFGGESVQMHGLLAAVREVNIPTLLLWPNVDAGADHISKSIRQFRVSHPDVPLRTLTNLTPENYLTTLACCTCAIGNSSSFVRDAGYFGTPVVLVGSRQDQREHDVHVTKVSAERDVIVKALRAQLAHGRYPESKLYGDGHVSQRVAAALVAVDLYVQKQLAYPKESLASS